MKKKYIISKEKNFLVIKNVSLKSINKIPKVRIINYYKEFGAILFRNFNINSDDLKEFTDRFTLNYANDAIRRDQMYDSKYIKSVDKGYQMMPLHSEASYSSSWPDIIWFYCDQPPKSSGYTTLCDGTTVYNNLSLNSKKFFLGNEIYYFVEMPVELKFKSKKIKREWHFDEVGCINPVLNHKTKKISFIQKRYAVNKVENLNKLSFANHLQIILSRDPQLKKWLVAGKNKIPKNILDDVKKVCKFETSNIEWKKKDLCMINNKRFMHGRTKIEGKDKTIRKIVNLQTLVSNIDYKKIN
jgi:alpha-ketoglutarate-dependent taurine dioxygenase